MQDIRIYLKSGQVVEFAAEYVKVKIIK